MDYYLQIKIVHIACVIASGLVFLTRGMLINIGYTNLAQRRGVRWMSYAIDTTLLTAGVLLVVILPRGMFANGWLATKLLVLVVYIVLGMFALKRGRTPTIRRIFYVAALLAYASIIGIAWAHQPLGWWYLWTHG
ncbi:MAG: SirB2 family protein [Rudaea sp.]